MTSNTTIIPSMNRLSVSKVEVKSGWIYTKLLWEQNPAELFRIQIFDSDNNSWSGSFSYDSFAQCREAFEEEDEVQYKSSVKEALSSFNDSYVYDFDVNKGEFRWKKKFPDVIIEHGRVSVQRDDVPAPVHTLIDLLLDQNHSLLYTIEEYSRNHESVVAELDRCKQELDNFVDTNISLEESIYSKFLLLLNEKKKRISMLDEALKSME